MSTPIVPDSAPGGKSGPAQKPLRNESRVLAGFIDDTERAIEALQSWLSKLRSWQHRDKVSRQEFEEIYAIICTAGLEDWARMGVAELRAAVTEEQAE